MKESKNKLGNKKIIGLIPARLGSVRVKAKNLRLINGKPLIYYAINAIKNSKIFDDKYVNSESELIGKVAERYGIKFYQRPKELATSTSMIDEYIYEFLNNVDCDVLAIINPTSPFLTSDEIDAAVNNFLENGFDTQLACQNIRTHCFLNGKAINFSTEGKHPRSQDLPIIQALNFAVTIWDAHKFKEQFSEKGHAVYTGKLGFYSFTGLAAIDIDWEEDFVLAELIMNNMEKFRNPKCDWDSVLEHIISNNENIQT
jgi:CMP-N,N'-diacetyllegionaminic acid synthase